LKIASISTFRVPCGVGKYFEELAYPLSDLVDLTIHAEKTVKEELAISKKSLQFIRDWHRSENNYDELFKNLVSEKPDVVHIQFESAIYNEGMFNNSNLLKLIKNLHTQNIPTVITLHNVPQYNPLMANVGKWYEDCDSHFIVTNKLMEEEFYKWLPSAKISVIPLGSTLFTPLSTGEARKTLSLPEDNFLIVQTGFYGKDKGMLQLIQAMPKILPTIPNSKLIFAGSIHPLAPPVHKSYLLFCMKTALNLGLNDKVIFTGKFLDEENLNLYLSSADIIAVNHQYIFGLFSSSASTHRALAAGKPMLLNKDDVRLSEFQDGIHCLKNTNENIAEKVIELYTNVSLREKIYKGASDLAISTSFKEIAEAHLKVYKNVRIKKD
jgi:glycosyltransferase involved in cell wall biosynthesis